MIFLCISVVFYKRFGFIHFLIPYMLTSLFVHGGKLPISVRVIVTKMYVFGDALNINRYISFALWNLL